MPSFKRKNNSYDKKVAEHYGLAPPVNYDPTESNDFELDEHIAPNLDAAPERCVVFVRNFRSVAKTAAHSAKETEQLALSYALACDEALQGMLPKQVTLEPTALDKKLADLFVESESLANQGYDKDSRLANTLCLDIYARFASRPKGRELQDAKQESLKQIDEARETLSAHGRCWYCCMNIALFFATFGLSFCLTGGNLRYFKPANEERLDALSDDIKSLSYNPP